jgi:tRNA(adenine34) deaminase
MAFSAGDVVLVPFPYRDRQGKRTRPAPSFRLAVNTLTSSEDRLDWSPFDLPLSDPRHPFHLHHMELALQEAETAAAADEVPVGAVIVSLEQGIIAQAHNQREQLRDPTAHAEMIAITQAAQALRSWRLENCVLYVTLEPCPMCAGAIVQARLPWVVYGAADPKAGACDTLYQITTDPRLNHRAQVIRGVLTERCAGVLSAFFAEKRRLGKG